MDDSTTLRIVIAGAAAIVVGFGLGLFLRQNPFMIALAVAAGLAALNGLVLIAQCPSDSDCGPAAGAGGTIIVSIVFVPLAFGVAFGQWIRLCRSGHDAGSDVPRQ